MASKQEDTKQPRLLKILEKKSKIPRDKWQWKHNCPKPMGYSISHFKKDAYSKTILPQEIRKISNKQLKCTP